MGHSNYEVQPPETDRLHGGKPLRSEFGRSTGAFRVMDPGPHRIVVVGGGGPAYGRVRNLVKALPRRWDCLRCDTTQRALLGARRGEAEVFVVALDEDPHAGLELIRRAREAGAQAVFFAMSERENPTLDLEAMEAGADGYLVRESLDAVGLDRAVRYAGRLRAAYGSAERQRSRYEQAIDALEYGVWDIDLHALDLYMCDRAAAMLGLADAETVRLESLAKLLDVPARRAVLAAANHCVTGERRDLSVEIRYVEAGPGNTERKRWLRLEGKLVRDELGRPHRLVGSIYDITSQKTTEQAMKRYALRDALTDLPNRRMLEERLGEAIASAEDHDVRCGAAFGLLYVDLDGFKPINDQYGHEAGDEVLKIVAERLSKCVRREDTVARVGGDEFVLLLQGPVPNAALERTRLQIRRALRKPMTVRGHTLAIDASVGTAVEGLDGHDPNALLASADKSMYRDKRNHKLQMAANCGTVFQRR